MNTKESLKSLFNLNQLIKIFCFDQHVLVKSEPSHLLKDPSELQHRGSFTYKLLAPSETGNQS